MTSHQFFALFARTLKRHKAKAILVDGAVRVRRYSQRTDCPLSFVAYAKGYRTVGACSLCGAARTLGRLSRSVVNTIVAAADGTALTRSRKALLKAAGLGLFLIVCATGCAATPPAPCTCGDGCPSPPSIKAKMSGTSYGVRPPNYGLAK